MKVSENLSVLFMVEKSLMSKDGLAPIYARITINGRRKEFSLGAKIPPDQWDAKTGRVIGKSSDALQINAQITQSRARLEKQYLILSAQFEYVTAEMLKKSYQGKTVKGQHEEDGPEITNLVQALDFYIKRFKEKVDNNNRSIHTLRKWNTTRDKICEFVKHAYRKKDIPLKSIQPGYAEDIYHYLTTEGLLNHNSAMKYVNNTKQVLKFAAGRWITSNPFDNYTCNYIQPGRDILSMPEIISLYRKPLNGRLDRVRDCFLFSCFTGLAYQELSLLSPADIVIGNDGYKWVMTNRVKTKRPENVPLLPIAENIVEKYKHDFECQVCEKLLPIVSNQKYNDYLKELTKECKIDKYITTHSGRHTFATTVCLENGVPIETVSKLLAHGSLKMTQIYAKTTLKKTSVDMQDLRKKLFSNNGELNEECMIDDAIIRIRQMNAEMTKDAV
jgi:site-specific recombinase XerD